MCICSYLTKPVAATKFVGQGQVFPPRMMISVVDDADVSPRLHLVQRGLPGCRCEGILCQDHVRNQRPHKQGDAKCNWQPQPKA